MNHATTTAPVKVHAIVPMTGAWQTLGCRCTMELRAGDFFPFGCLNCGEPAIGWRLKNHDYHMGAIEG